MGKVSNLLDHLPPESRPTGMVENPEDWDARMDSLLPNDKVIDLLDVLPSRPNPMELGKIVEPVAPFLRGDSFEDWVSLRNYELGRPPLSSDEMQALRTSWRK